MVPVVVSGTFSSPKFRPDVSAAAKQEIQKQIFKSKEGQSAEKSAKDALKGILGD